MVADCVEQRAGWRGEGRRHSTLYRLKEMQLYASPTHHHEVLLNNFVLLASYIANLAQNFYCPRLLQAFVHPSVTLILPYHPFLSRHHPKNGSILRIGKLYFASSIDGRPGAPST